MDYEHLKEAARSSSFEKPRNLEQVHGIPGHDDYTEDPGARRCRKGRARGYLEDLDEEDPRFIAARSADLLTEPSKEFLSRFGLFPV